MANHQISLEQSVPVGPFLTDNKNRFATMGKPHGCRPEIEELLNEEFLYLVGRQVPSCLSLTRIGTRISYREATVLRDCGFPLLQQTHPGGPWNRVEREIPMESGVSQSQKEALADLIRDQVSQNSSFQEENPLSGELFTSHSSETESEDGDVEPLRPGGSYRFEYGDPFAINAAVVVGESRGKRPEVLSWPGGTFQMQHLVPRRAMRGNPDTEPEYVTAKAMPFYDIASVGLQMNVLLYHTHWGILLKSMASDKTDPTGPYCRGLIRRIKLFLGGRGDPRWRGSRPGAPEDLRGARRKRSLRFLQILQTVDGLFSQVYLADPTAGWDWSLYDKFVIRHIALLLDDEFFDSPQVLEEIPETHYETLKKFRGEMKEAFLRGRRLPLPRHSITACFRPVVEILNDLEPGLEKTQRCSVLFQTRGAGTPPPCVVLRSKEKFLLTVTEEEEFKPERLSLNLRVLNKVINSIPDSAFTGLQTKAAIRITSSACLEKTRAEGGTTEAIRLLLDEGRVGRQVRIICLETGKGPPTYKSLEEMEPGEYIFWRCLEEVLSTDPDVLREASLVMIREPAKARTVTKARAPLKIVLDVINGICSYPLKKGVRSSESGMGKAHHGWNFFKEFFSSWKELAFKVRETPVYPGGADSYECRVYDDLYVGCTDYSEATDRMLHRTYASPAAELWMRRCGIPKLLRGIVHETCFKPRRIFFSGQGRLERIGEPCPTAENPHRRMAILKKGVLMGDPLTKVLLHIVNLCVRGTAGCCDPDRNAFDRLTASDQSMVGRCRLFYSSERL